MRIARELHDTLLQSVQGLMFSFQAARNLLPERTDEAIRTLDQAIREGDAAIADGRDAIQGLRADPSLSERSGGSACCRGKGTREILHARMANRAEFRVIVEGAPRRLSPLFRTRSIGWRARSFATPFSTRTPAASRPKSPTTPSSSG